LLFCIEMLCNGPRGQNCIEDSWVVTTSVYIVGFTLIIKTLHFFPCS